MLRAVPLILFAVLAVSGCAPQQGEDLPPEWMSVKEGMLVSEVQGLLGRKPDGETTTTGTHSVYWNSRTHTLTLSLKGGKVADVFIVAKHL